MSSYVLYLRPATTIGLPASGDAIIITTAQATTAAAGSYDLVVEGIVRGSASCLVRLLLRTEAKSDTPQINASGFFSAAFPGVGISPGEAFSVEASNSDAGATGTDALLLAFPSDRKLDLPGGSLAALEPQRYAYQAGSPDRIVETKTFNQLVVEPLIVARGSLLTTAKKAVYGNVSADLRVRNIEKQLTDGRDAVAPLWAQFKAGDISYTHFLAQARDALRRIDTNVVGKPSKAEIDNWRKLFDQPRNRRRRSANFGAKYTGPRLQFVTVGGNSYGRYDPVQLNDPRVTMPALPFDPNDPFKWTDALLSQDDFGGRVGLLFSDRLRFQPSGLVIGEPVYTLALAPGEEVEVRQVVETKRKSTIEDIVDREQELSLNLTSSWTNEITEGVTSQSTIQQAVHVGADANAQLPVKELPIGFGVNVSNDASAADALTREHSTKTAVERTSTAAAKMRSQHKIRMEVTNETGNTLATTRKLKNANSQRSQIHIFSKVYRKERVTLERYGMQLCFRLTVHDPSFRARANFLANLDKFDPTLPEHYGQAPTGISAEESFEFEYGVSTGGFDESSNWLCSKQIDLRADLKVPGGGAIPAGYVLSGTRLRLVNYKLETYDNSLFDSSTTNSTGRTRQAFESDGGRFGWEVAPPSGSTEAKGTLAVSLSHRWSAYVVYVHGQLMRKARVKVQADWVPTQADYDTLAQTNQQKRTDLLAVCTDERIRQIRDNAIADYPGQVLAEAISRHLRPTQNMVELRRIFDFESAIVESAPFWASAGGIANYRALERRLVALPVPLAISQTVVQELVAPQATVYVPVFEGHALDALDLLPGVDRFERDRVEDDIRRYRAQKFPPLATQLPTYDQVLGPTPAFGTSAGSDAWNTEWEKPQRQFDVIAHWQLLTPTDGVHLETRLSDSVATDEHQTRMLENQTRG